MPCNQEGPESSRPDLFDRASLGLDRTKSKRLLIYWHVTDAIYLALLIILFPFVRRIQPFQRQFTLNDVTIQHPFAKHERVPNYQLFLFCTVVPAATLVLGSFAAARPGARAYTCYVSVLGLLLAVFTTSILTDVLKNFFGRLRPDFLARCLPDSDAPVDVLVTAGEVCMTDNMVQLMDGFRTTPLGHLSLSFAGLFFLSLWLCGQLKVTRPHTGAWRWAVCAAPTVGALLIALTRTQDYRHHFIDVLIGLIFGSVIAVWLYFRLFPSLGHVTSHQPILYLLADAENEYDPVATV
ncbi:acid phosphatase/Vanadium-dependent haloperoxidase [Metschnikowia bicuspidata]|uniref:Acid phosphatase/Vanadium-dependent haloperoxidase n=1 Tax=Metschnikowia bicuspidata TaxID=27322 RepID=A0A4P9ZES7_9ASCO|nr:acid phosphatase/Vanadium-dependent haloperoxidase [Metschnikowia bicuspidata]